MTTGSNMKRFITAYVLFVGALNVAMAQDVDPWVGTWTSESYKDIDWDNSPGDEIEYAYFKRIIRIEKSKDLYNVRTKIIKVGDLDYARYTPSIIVKEVDGPNMWLESFLEKEPFTVNDKIESYRDVTYRMKLSLKQGILHYSFYEFSYIEFDSRMSYKEQGTVKVGGDGSELDLFSDDW